jgi:hypothetical protein
MRAAGMEAAAEAQRVHEEACLAHEVAQREMRVRQPLHPFWRPF